MRSIRWSDNDRYFGPFTYAPGDYWRLAMVLGSGDGDDYPDCRLRLCIGRRTLIVALPPIIRPSRQWVDTSGYGWSRDGGGYWDSHEREYGFSYSEGFLQVFLGRQTHDSSTTQSWSKFLPWTQWRHVRHSLYGLSGEHYADAPQKAGWISPEREAWDRVAEACPTCTMAFADFDGEHLTVATRIEEREWHFGTGWFKWLSLFRRPKISRSLDLRFSGETGRRKGSWKGGTIGHSIEMLPGETHWGAFSRYCAENNMTFLGVRPERAA